MLKKAIAQATGVNVNHINAEYKKAGDLGLVAMVSSTSVCALQSTDCTDTRQLVRIHEQHNQHFSSQNR